ncbi:MAG TPA: hypothetical protein VNL71_23690 [Chloroflexota bacterium]|nr:hypothetical protein [Chloroflexota bacterium]
MAKLTRNGFLKQASAGAATIGALTALPGLAATAHAAPKTTVEADLSAATLREPLVAYVREAASGEISLLVGTREITLHNPELVMQLIRAAR